MTLGAEGEVLDQRRAKVGAGAVGRPVGRGVNRQGVVAVDRAEDRAAVRIYRSLRGIVDGLSKTLPFMFGGPAGLPLLLATALGWGDRNWTPADIRRLIRDEVEGYGDVSEEELAGGGLMKKGLFVSTGAL